ncbi:TetR/AcrR family transcriptional regulator [Rhodococcus sp. NPDC057014]|uniref:TetR/AcrR family transcriptional regulator n=1 Tax=Rhodococcus sp. NPDC057014 TaxID=3346000 RepID=UPI00363511FD
MKPDLPSLSELKRNVTRSRLTGAALEVFETKGYSATTIDDIVSAAGVSRATFYLHFPNKLALTREMLDDLHSYALHRYSRLDEVLTSGEEDLRQSLRDWLREWQQYWRKNAALLDALTAAALSDASIEDWIFTSSFTLIDSLHRYFDQIPEAEASAVRTRAVLLEASTRTVFSLSSRGKVGTSPDEVLDYLCDVWTAALQPK